MESKFNIGDKVYTPIAASTGILIDCPECFGRGKLTCILGDGSKVEFDCGCCDKKDMVNPSGKIRIYKYHASVETVMISGIELTNKTVKYRTGSSCCYRTFNEEDLYLDQNEALAMAEIKVAEHEVEQEQKILMKKDIARQSWAFNVSYHRRNIRDLEQKLEYHKRKLGIDIEKAEKYKAKIK
jgi:hypothetical protein